MKVSYGGWNWGSFCYLKNGNLVFFLGMKCGGDSLESFRGHGRDCVRVKQ